MRNSRIFIDTLVTVIFLEPPLVYLQISGQLHNSVSIENEYVWPILNSSHTLYVSTVPIRTWNKDWKVLGHMSSQDEICSDVYQKWSDIRN